MTRWLLIVVLCLGAVTGAQSPSSPVVVPPSAWTPAEQKLLALEGRLQSQWLTEARALPSFKTWTEAREAVEVLMKQEHPGQRMNWDTRTLEPAK